MSATTSARCNSRARADARYGGPPRFPFLNHSNAAAATKKNANAPNTASRRRTAVSFLFMKK
jgi:hypothetical protein